jgi:uncharacterized protein YaeQ
MRDLTGAIGLWIELGHPDERTLAKAVGRSPRVIVYTYSPNPRLWWEPIQYRFEGEGKLSVFNVSSQSAKELAGMVEASMNLQVSIQDGEIWFRDDKDRAVRVEMEEAQSYRT